MKSTILLFFSIAIFSCKEKQDRTTNSEPEITAQDSVGLQQDDPKIVYIERASLDLENYLISIKTKFDIPRILKEDSSYYFEGNILFIRSKMDNATDSVKIEAYHYDPSQLRIEDFSDSLHFKTLLLRVSWLGDSDQEGDEFIEYGNHSLKQLFAVDNLVALKRVNEWTLGGFVADRDEVVGSVQMDYPLMISLKDYEVHVTRPDKQSIGYTTVALEDIEAYHDPRLSPVSAYTIKKDQELVVDSIYRSLKLVRLIVSDSVILYARPDTISEKVQRNEAG